jgi:hypothetical protein
MQHPTRERLITVKRPVMCSNFFLREKRPQL